MSEAAEAGHEHDVPTVNGFAILEKLGAGAFATVHLCKRVAEQEQDPGQKVSEAEEEKLYAVKIFNKSLLRKQRNWTRVGERMVVSTGLTQVEREIALLKKMAHPTVVKLHEVIDDEDNDRLYLIMEYVEGGQVMHWDHKAQRYISPATGGPLPEDVARAYFRDLVTGIDYLHQHRIIHRDIKPENLLVAPGAGCKIADFGVAHLFDTQASGNVQGTHGTPHFLAPECINDANCDGFKLDIWAMGITLFAFMFGTVPYHDENPLALMERIGSEPIEWPPMRALSPALVNLLRSLLDRNPATRPSIGDVARHEWVTYTGPLPVTPTASLVGVTDEDIQRAISKPSLFMATARLRLGQKAARARKNAYEKRVLQASAAMRTGAGAREAAEAVQRASAATPAAAAASPGGARGPNLGVDFADVMFEVADHPARDFSMQSIDLRDDSKARPARNEHPQAMGCCVTM